MVSERIGANRGGVQVVETNSKIGDAHVSAVEIGRKTFPAIPRTSAWMLRLVTFLISALTNA